ncbi:hypothetical protein [Nocardia gipuzkoensis]
MRILPHPTDSIRRRNLLTYLITDVRGTVVGPLRTAGRTVRAASSPPETTAPDSVELVGLDPAAPESVTAAFKGIDNVIAAAKAPGAAHIALLPSIATATTPPASTPSARRDRPPARPTHPRTHPD